jgi:transcriptional regulator with XRE-family HTH domain
MVALPCCHVTLGASRPKGASYPARLHTIGDHLRKRRLDLGLLQKPVAKQIGVTKATIQYWENNRVSPAIRFMPRITSFLTYDLTDSIGQRSLVERLRHHRRRLGLSQKRLAALLGINESTVAGWERAEHRPAKTSVEVITEFLSVIDLQGMAQLPRKNT